MLIEARGGLTRLAVGARAEIERRSQAPLAAEVVGSIVEHDLLEALVTGKAAPDDQVAMLMSPPLPSVGSGEPVSVAALALSQFGAAVVLFDGKPAGVITRQDLLTFLSGQPG